MELGRGCRFFSLVFQSSYEGAYSNQFAVLSSTDLCRFREKRKEKEREELWKSLEQLEIDHKMKRNFTPNATHDNTTTEPQEIAAQKDDLAC